MCQWVHSGPEHHLTKCDCWLSISSRHSRKDAQRAGVNTASFLLPFSLIISPSLFFPSFNDLSLPIIKVFMLYLPMSSEREVVIFINRRQATSSSLRALAYRPTLLKLASISSSASLIVIHQ